MWLSDAELDWPDTAMPPTVHLRYVVQKRGKQASIKLLLLYQELLVTYEKDLATFSLCREE